MSTYIKPRNLPIPPRTANTPPMREKPARVIVPPVHSFWAEREEAIANGNYEMPEAIRLVKEYQSPEQRQMGSKNLTAQIVREQHIMEVLKSDSQQWQHLCKIGLSSKLQVPYAGIESAIRGAVSLLVLDERRNNQIVSDENLFLAVEHRFKHYRAASLSR